MKNNICNHKSTEIKYRIFKKCDYESLREDLENAICPNVKLINVNEAAESFTSTFTLIIDRHFPQTIKRVKRIKQPGWMNTEIMKCMKLRDGSKKGSS